jgi:hypothetical protein
MILHQACDISKCEPYADDNQNARESESDGWQIKVLSRSRGPPCGRERPGGRLYRRGHAVYLAPTIQELQAAGCESLRAIAAGLDERDIPAARGGKWSAVQVARLLEAAAVPFDAGGAIAVA